MYNTHVKRKVFCWLLLKLGIGEAKLGHGEGDVIPTLDLTTFEHVVYNQLSKFVKLTTRTFMKKLE